jgi:flagellar hook assembly protein FlgD
VPQDRPVATLELADVRPNPAVGPASVSFSLSRPGPVTLEILDVQGRRVRMLAHGAQAAGPHRVDWDGRTDAGVAARAGIYLLRMEAEGRVMSRKLARVQ